MEVSIEGEEASFEPYKVLQRISVPRAVLKFWICYHFTLKIDYKEILTEFFILRNWGLEK